MFLKLIDTLQKRNFASYLWQHIKTHNLAYEMYIYGYYEPGFYLKFLVWQRDRKEAINWNNNSSMSLTILGVLGTKIWLGALKARGQWRWDGLHTGQLTSTNWNRGEPNNKGGKENCIETYTDGVWRDQHCSDLLPYVCEIPAQ